MEPEQNPSTEPPMEQSIEPCEHMQNNISALSDDSLHGLARWYTQLHASYCPKCGPALQSLRRLHARLSRLRQTPLGTTEDLLTEETRTALHQAMETVESSHVLEVEKQR